MFGHKNNRNGEKVFRYSIRKYHFGAASVAIAALLFFANGVARADSLSVSPDTAATEKTLNDEGRSRAKEEPLPNSQELAERNLEEKTTKVVDKSALLQVMDELKEIVVKVKESKLAPLSNQLLQLTDESKRLLSDKDAKSEDIDQHILKIRKLIETLKEQESSASQPERKEESKVPSAEAVDETANQAESSNAKDSLLEDKSTNEAATEVRKEETSRDSSKPTVTASDRSLNKVDKEANSLELPNKDNKLLPIDTKSNLVDEATEDVLDKKKKGYSGFRIAHYAARSIDRSVAGNLDSGTISGDGVKQFENLHYDIDGDRTIWRVAVRPAHKNHAWAGIAVTSDDTIENIRVVERGGAGGSVLEEREISRGRPASTPFSNYKMFIGHYRLIGGAVPDRIVYEVTTRGTHHNLFARFATAIVQNTLENSGLSGKAAITSRNSDFPAVGIHVNAVGAPTVNHNYTRTNDTVRMQTVPSTDNQLSGTGKPGATISVKKNGNTFKKTKVDGSGHWVVSLDAGLNSNLSDTGEQLVPKDKITVTQSVDGKESEATNVDVSLGRSWIDHSPGHPVGEVTSNQRNIKLFVPHDAGMAYLKYRDTNNQEHQVAIRRTTINQQWQSLQSNLATVTSVDNTSNKFYSIINLRLNSDMKVGSQTSVISNMKEGGYGSLEGWKPVNVVEAPLTSGAHIESDLTGKASIPADVRVKAPVGSTVKLYDNNDVLIGEAQAGNDGYATVHPRNSLPEGQVRATSTPAGGKESAKSDPVNVTKTVPSEGPGDHKKPAQPTNTQILISKTNIVAYRGDTVDVTITAASNAIEKFWIANDPYSFKGIVHTGQFRTSAGDDKTKVMTAYTRGTIAMDQPLGTNGFLYAVTGKARAGRVSRENPSETKTVQLDITVLEVAKKYDISIDKKITVENPNAVSTPEKEKIIAAIKEKNNRTYTDAAYRALLDQATYSVDEKGNVTITYPDKSVDKVASSYTIQKRPVIETSLVDKADTQTPITVSADPGSKVKLYDHSGHELGEGTADGNGRVTINPTRPIPNGNVTAKATDNRDNTTDASVAKQATVPAPQNLVIQQPNHGSTSVTITPQGRADIISAVIQGKKVKIEKEGSGRYKTLENAANVRISPNSNGSVTFELPSGTRFETLDRIQATAENKDITVASGIRSSGEANQYVLHNRGEKVPVKDINRLTPADKERVKTAYEKANPGINKSEVTVGSNGDIDYDHQGRGSIQKGNAKLTGNVVLDNVAPGKPTIPTNLTDKAGTRTQIEVDTEPGASVVVYDHGDQELGHGVANARGKAFIDPTKEIPKGNVTAKATDEAGNISQPSDAKVATFQDFTPKVPSKTPVTKVTSLTPDEVNQVKKKVSDANPGKEVQVSTNGTATVTDPKSRISHQISGDKLVESNDKIKPTVEIPYDNPARQEIYVYSGENNDITLKAWDNSGKISKLHLAFAADNRQGLGTEDSYLNGKTRSALYLSATKIHTDTPASQNSPAILKVTGEIPKGEFNEQSGQISRYLFAEDPSGNTNYEHVGHANDVGAPGRIRFVWKPQTFKYDAQAPSTPLLLDNADATQIENAVKQANPTFSDKIKSVTVNGNNVIVTYKDDSTDRLDASKVFKVRDSKPTPPTATAPKDGTVTVTPTGDADKVTVNYTDEKEQNKTVTVVKAKNGTWSSSDKPAGVTVDSRTGTLLIPAEGVKDRSQVTATATKGDSHPSEPTTVTAQPKDFTSVNQDFTPVKPDEKVPVKDKDHLTKEEKKQVEDKVKAKNPGKEVTVGEDGTATLKDPTTGISHQIPGSDLVNQDFTPVKPDEKVPVKDKAHLTPEEKKQVEDKVKAKNPGKEVTVGEDGTATLKDPTTGISHQIPGSDLVNQDFTPVKPDEKVPVKDKAHLTPEEKKQVEDKVKAKNPGKEVTVGEDGTATLKDPTTGISHQIPGSDLVNQDFTPVKPDEKVPVKDKAHLTPEEKKQVEDKVKAKNPGKEVTVGEDGTATLKDPTTGISHQIPGSDLVNQDFTPVKPDEKVPVKDKAHLTPEEKKQVEDKVKAKNPGKEVTVGEDGTATLKDPTTGISHQIPGSDLVNQGFTPVKPDEKVPVKDKAHLTPEEKKQVEDKVKAKNPGKEVTVGEDGTATLKDPTTGISHQIPGSDLVNQGFTPVKPDEKVPVKDKAHLTPEEKKQVEDKVKAKNPGKEVTVGEDGTATLKDPTTGISHQIPGSDLVNQDFTPVKPDEKVPVKDKAHLTPEEKKQVEDKVKAKNPGKEVTVGEDGTATLKDPTTGISHQIPGSDLVNQDFTPVKPDEKVPVKDKAHLTPEEKKQVEDKVKAKNPGKEVTVGEDGTATLKDPTTGISHQIPGSDLVNQDFTPVKPDEKVPVKDKAHLTPEEKKQVEDKVKAKNPGKEVTVGEDGTATLKDPTTGISHQIPGSDLVNQDFTPVKPDEKVPVKDKAHVTPEEKKQVEDKVKAKNPGKEVTVGEDGTATLKDPTTGISHQIPGSDLVNQGFTPVKPDEKVPVKDKAHLTPEEKKQVEDKVKAKNPGKEVTVGEDGTATLKDPTTGISHQIPGSDLVNQDFTPVKPDEKVPVKDKAHLTPEEKKQVEDKVKAKNPGKEVTVGEDGTATLKDPTTGISHQIPGSDLVNQDFTPVKPDEKVPVKDKAHVTPEEKKQVEDKVKAKNPGKEVTVGEDGTATLKDPTTGISHQIPGSDLVNQGFTPVKPDEKVPVKDKAHLTPEEKKQVEDKVKAKNPGKEVTVGEDGTATLKDPTTGISHQIPGSDLVNQDFTPVKPDEKVPVKDKAHLTPEEKKQVEDKVKAKNPGKEVTVGEDGTATLKDPTTGISHQIPGSDLVNQGFTPVKPDEKVPVKDKAHLTPEEKKQVEDKVKAKNPGKEVTVGEDGTATLKDPTTGISHQIPGSDLVNQDFTPVKPDEKVPVKDKAHLTPEEKKQVEDKVKAKNPGKEVTVGEDGTATLKDPTTGISHQIPGSDLVNQDSGVNGIPEVSPSQPAYTDPVGTSSTDGEGNVITPPTAEFPAYTDPVGTSSTDGEGNVITPPTVEVPAYTDPVGTSSTDGEGNVITPPTVEIPAYTGSVNGIPEVTPAQPDYEGSVNSIPEEMPAQPDYDGSANEMSEETPTSETTINKDRQLPNTGTEKSNTSLVVALLAAMTGGLLISRKRKEEE